MLNSLGKYIYRSLSGAYKWKKSSHMFDIWTIVLYQIPKDVIEKYKLPEEFSDVYEMTLNINLVKYDDKIRVNIIELSEAEYTLGSQTFTLDPKKYKDTFDMFKHISDKVISYIYKCLNRRYEDYEFLY